MSLLYNLKKQIERKERRPKNRILLSPNSRLPKTPASFWGLHAPPFQTGFTSQVLSKQGQAVGTAVCPTWCPTAHRVAEHRNTVTPSWVYWGPKLTSGHRHSLYSASVTLCAVRVRPALCWGPVCMSLCKCTGPDDWAESSSALQPCSQNHLGGGRSVLFLPLTIQTCLPVM